MITRIRAAGLLWPGLIAIATFCALIALGNWQWSRMHWKQGMIKQLEQAAKGEPVAMQVIPRVSAAAKNDDISSMQFRRISVRGTFEHDHEMHVWAPQKTGPAWSVVTPLRIDPEAAKRVGLSSAQASHILVIRGIVPEAAKQAGKRITGQIEGAQMVVGRVRLDQPNAWANEPNIEKRQWFTRDLMAMSAHLASAMKREIAMAPFFLEAEQQLGGAEAPKPALKALSLTNRHLSYALTWWGLAMTLAGVFMVFAWGRITYSAK